MATDPLAEPGAEIATTKCYSFGSMSFAASSPSSSLSSSANVNRYENAPSSSPRWTLWQSRHCFAARSEPSIWYSSPSLCTTRSSSNAAAQRRRLKLVQLPRRRRIAAELIHPRQVVEHVDPRPVELQQADEFDAINRPFASPHGCVKRVTMESMFNESSHLNPRSNDSAKPFVVKKIKRLTSCKLIRSASLAVMHVERAIRCHSALFAAADDRSNAILRSGCMAIDSSTRP